MSSTKKKAVFKKMGWYSDKMVEFIREKKMRIEQQFTNY